MAINHSERGHALLSASGAKRWIKCPPSARMEDMFEDVTSDYAREGTLAHELSELKLRKYLSPLGLKKYNIELKKIKSDNLYKNEMEGFTEFYVDHIKELLMKFNGNPINTTVIEKKVNFSEYVPDGFGTADFISIDTEKKVLYIRDLKYGKGVPVFAENNPQLMLYALGAYLEYSLYFGIDFIDMGIVQPRLDSVSTFQISSKELMDWAENEVRPAAQKAYEGDGEFTPGECTFCRAKALCKARAEKNLELETEMKLKGNVLTNEELGEILKKAQDLVKWVKDIENQSLTKLLNGEEIPGWKVVEGRSIRQIKDSDKLVEALKENDVEEALLFEKRLLPLTQLEGIVGKKRFGEIAGDLIIKPKGKPTLVVESDKRKKYEKDVIDASDEFKKIEE